MLHSATAISAGQPFPYVGRAKWSEPHCQHWINCPPDVVLSAKSIEKGSHLLAQGHSLHTISQRVTGCKTWQPEHWSKACKKVAMVTTQ